jgi:hypothetical protein
MNKHNPKPLAPADLTKEFMSIFNETARYHHRMEVFRDFVTVSAIALSNGADKGPERDKREEEYLGIMKRYKSEDVHRLTRLLSLTVEILELGPEDFLGKVFMDLELGDARRGQFYTPHNVSKMMAEITYMHFAKDLEEKPFITLSEPACGAGGMILPFVELMLRAGHDPARKIWIQAVDVDRTSALMCFIQLSLWGLPAEIIVGDTLRMEIRETWYTPMYHLLGWRARLDRAGIGSGFIAA